MRLRMSADGHFHFLNVTVLEPLIAFGDTDYRVKLGLNIVRVLDIAPVGEIVFAHRRTQHYQPIHLDPVMRRQHSNVGAVTVGEYVDVTGRMILYPFLQFRCGLLAFLVAIFARPQKLIGLTVRISL